MNRVIIYHFTLCVQTDSGSQPATNSMDRKLTKVKIDHSPPSTIKVNLWSYTYAVHKEIELLKYRASERAQHARDGGVE